MPTRHDDLVGGRTLAGLSLVVEAGFAVRLALPARLVGHIVKVVETSRDDEKEGRRCCFRPSPSRSSGCW